MPRRRSGSPTGEQQSADGRDPLGKLLKVYRPHLGGCIFVTGMGLLVGLMGVVFAVLLSGNAIVITAASAVAVLILLGALGYSIVNYRQRLELHKGGVRYRKGDRTVEMAWDEVYDIQVGRSNFVGYGPARAMTRSEDPESEDDWLTERRSLSFWEVTLVDSVGQSIYLNQMFMGCIADPRKLIRNLRKATGIEAGEVRGY